MFTLRYLNTIQPPKIGRKLHRIRRKQAVPNFTAVKRSIHKGLNARQVDAHMLVYKQRLDRIPHHTV